MGVFIATWQLAVRRSLANWRLLSSVAAGVLLAVALVFAAPLYANALDALGLAHAIRETTLELLDIQLITSNYRVRVEDYQKLTEFVDAQVQNHVGDITRQRVGYAKSQTFYTAWPDRTIPTGNTRPRGHFQFFTDLEEHIKLVEGSYPQAVTFPEPEDTETPLAPMYVMVANTDGEGVFIRKTPYMADRLVSWPDATLMEVIGEGRESEGRHWVNVRDPDGREGWLPAEYSVAVADPQLEIEGAISSGTAEMFGLSVGDQLLFIPYWTRGPRQLTVKITGIIEPIDPEEEYWLLYQNRFTYPAGEYITAPVFVPEQTFLEGIAHFCPLLADYSWYLYLDTAKIDATKVPAIREGITNLRSELSTKLPRLMQLTTLDRLLEEYEKKLLFTHIPLFLLIFQIVGIVLYYLVMVSTMLIQRQSGEISLFKSRGASTGQILGVYFMEGILICGLAAVVGPFLGAAVFSLLGKTGPFSPLTQGGLLPIRLSSTGFFLGIGAAGLSLIALLVPAFQAARQGVVHYRQQVARPARAPFWERYYLDLVLVGIGAILYWELRQRGTLLTHTLFGQLSADPLMLISPTLFVVAVAILLLRFFPLLMRLVTRLYARWASAPVMLGLWYIVRNPLHYTRLVLLLMIVAAVGMFSASFSGTLRRSYDERVTYQAGSDIRLVGMDLQRQGKEAFVSSLSAVPGVEAVGAVYRGQGMTSGLFGSYFTLVAVDPLDFARVAWYREDFSQKSLGELMGQLAQNGPAEEGKQLPPQVARLGLWVRPRESYPNCTLFLRLKDSKGSYFDLNLGDLGFDDWRFLAADLESLSGSAAPVPPIDLRSVYVDWKWAQTEKPPEIYFDDLQAFASAETEATVLDDFEDVAEWKIMPPAGTSEDSFAKQEAVVYSGASAGKLTFSPGNRGVGTHGFLVKWDDRPMSVMASPSFLSAVGRSPGDLVTISLGGQSFLVEIVDVVDYFPSLDPAKERFVIANLDRVLYVLNRRPTGLSYYPNEAWISISGDEEQREETLATLNGLKLGTQKVYDREELLAKSKSDPLVAGGWGGILFLCFLAISLLSALGFLVYSYLSAQRRRLEFAILRTMGLSVRQLLGLVCFEQILVVGIGMLAGSLMGLRLGSMMMSFLELTERGEKVLPPFIIQIDWLSIGSTYLVLAIIFALAVSAVVWYFSRLAIHQALRIGEE